MTSKLKVGIVVRHRVNPKDCQSVLDILDKLGVNYRIMSFSQCVSIAFSSLMETARAQKLIPEPDPFQFSNRLGIFSSTHPEVKARKLELTRQIGTMGSKFQPAALQPRETYATMSVVPSYVEEALQSRQPTADEMRARSRLTELVAKKEMVEDGAPGVVWQTSDQEEWDRLYPIVYPEG